MLNMSDITYTRAPDKVTGALELTGFGKEVERFEANGYTLSIDLTKVLAPTK